MDLAIGHCLLGLKDSVLKEGTNPRYEHFPGLNVANETGRLATKKRRALEDAGYQPYSLQRQIRLTVFHLIAVLVSHVSIMCSCLFIVHSTLRLHGEKNKSVSTVLLIVE